MFNDCPDCATKNTLLEEKENKIRMYQNNLSEVKNKIQDSNNLLNHYFTSKSENSILRNELEDLKKRSVDNINTSQIKYDFDVLWRKWTKEEQLNKSLQSENDQLKAMLDKTSNDKDIKSEVSKVKKEISKKDIKINEQHLQIAQLNTQIYNMKKGDNEASLTRVKEDPPVVFSTQNDYSVKQLIDENDYLKKKYHKYQTKYIKYKSKYEECKRLVDCFTQTSGFNRPMMPIQSNISDVNLATEYRELRYNDEQQYARQSSYLDELNLEKKRSNLSQIFEEKHKNEIFTNIDLDVLDMHEEDKGHLEEVNELENVEENIEEVNVEENLKESVEEKKNKKKKKEAKKKKKEKKTKSKEVKKEVNEGGSEDLEAIRQKNKEKLIKALKKQRTKTNDKKQEEKNITEEEIPIFVDTRDPLSHIYPLPRPKLKMGINEIIIKNEKKLEEFITLINNIDFTKDQIISYLTAETETSNYEKIINYLSYIDNQIAQIDLIKVLFFMDTVIDYLNDTGVFTYFKEYILTNLEYILNKKEGLHIDSMNIQHLDYIYPYKDNSLTVQEMITHEYLLVSLLLGIFYKDIKITQQIYELIFELFYKYSTEIMNIFVLLKRLVSKYPPVFDWTIDSNILASYNNNVNRLYFFNSYKMNIITENIASLLYELLGNVNSDDAVLSLLYKTLEGMEDRSLSDGAQLDLSKDLRILEVIQIIDICFRIRGLDWIDRYIFDTLWKYFIALKAGSLKRTIVIYYISYILSTIATGAVNDIFLKIYTWISKILDQNTDANISVYDKIAALSGFVELAKYDPVILNTVQMVIHSMVNTYTSEILPSDLLDNLTKLGIYNK
jgi:hypothetical protein